MNVQVFLINLDRDVTKYRKSMKILKENGFDSIQRISAIDGRKVDTNKINLTWYTKYLLKKPQNRCAHEQLNTLGGIGCYLSHIKCWKKLINSKYEGAFIFEDDLEVIKNFADTFNQLTIPSDCDYLAIGYIFANNIKKVNDQFIKCDTFTGTQGYFITTKGAKKLLKYIYPIESQIDGFISMMNYFKKINLYLVNKPLVVQNNITSSSINYIDCYKCYLPNSLSNTFTPYIFIILTMVVFLIILLLIKIKWIN